MAIRYTASTCSGKSSPSNENIGKLAEQSYRALPQSIHALRKNITLCIEEIADMDLIEFLGGTSPYDLMGSPHPIGKTFLSSDKQAPITHIIAQEIEHQLDFEGNQLKEIEISTNQGIEYDSKSLMQ